MGDESRVLLVRWSLMHIQSRTYTFSMVRCQTCRREGLTCWSGFLSEPHVCLRCVLACRLPEDERAEAIRSFAAAQAEIDHEAAIDVALTALLYRSFGGPVGAQLYRALEE